MWWFLCFEINTKIDEQLLFDLSDKHKKENSEELESNDDDSVAKLEDTIVAGYEAGKCAKNPARYFQI